MLEKCESGNMADLFTVTGNDTLDVGYEKSMKCLAPKT
jgi:hypothetical protein